MYISIHNRKIHYKQIGSGEPLILLHGWGNNSYSLHQLAQKASRKFTVYSIDLPGFGKSDNPPRHWGLDGYAFLVKEFIRKKKLHKPSVMGHAFGASIGIILAAKEQNLLHKLVISSCPIHQAKHTSPFSAVSTKIPQTHPVIADVYKNLRNIYYQIFARSSDLPKYPSLEENFKRIVAQDLSPFLTKVKIPTLILWGEEDTCTPVLYAYEIKQKIKDARLYSIPQVAHDVPQSAAPVVWKEMKGFLLS